MTGTKAVMYVRMNLDNRFVGAFLGAAALGVYTLAFTFTEGLRSQVAAAISRVMLPAYSQHQHEPEALRAHYLHATRVMLLALAPLSLAVLLYAQPLCAHVLGPAWAEAALPMQILAVGGLLHAASGPSADVLQALGRTELLFRMAWRNLFAFALPCMALLTWWQGVAGAACAYVLTVATQRVMLHRSLHETLGLQSGHLWQAGAAPLGLIVGVCATAWALRGSVSPVVEAGLVAATYAVVGIRLLRR
jgi:O-antigen/teichoic acid export membrane protein